jgi:predicted AlkP superfamily phosphohydrolase/phosphomutase
MPPNKLVILCLDGTPYSLIQKLISYGIMPNLDSLVKTATIRPMNSVLPTVSSVAWASFLTGRSPAQHGIYGFIERNPETMDVFVPTAQNMIGRTLPEVLSEQDKRVFSMNVPISYPPRKVNGIEISGFLCPDIQKGTYPQGIAAKLQNMDYRIDVDTVSAREDLEHFAAELLYTYEKRIQAMWQFWQQEDWDFFLVHIMETDRLHHFIWEFMEQEHPRWGSFFMDFYRRIDTLIGQLVDTLGPDHELVIMSDHGFTTLKKEVYINKWLYDSNYLRYKSDKSPDSLNDIHPQTVAYSLIPGRIYINLSGREKDGSVRPGMAYERLREELREGIQSIRDPQTGEAMVRRVWTREEYYNPKSKVQSPKSAEQAQRKTQDQRITGSKEFNPKSKIQNPKSKEQAPVGADFNPAVVSADNGLVDFWDRKNPAYFAPDLIIEPHAGYDFKGNLWYPQLTEKGPINGTHTYDDAFVLSTGLELPEKDLSIVDCFKVICDFYNRHGF